MRKLIYENPQDESLLGVPGLEPYLGVDAPLRQPLPPPLRGGKPFGAIEGVNVGVAGREFLRDWSTRRSSAYLSSIRTMLPVKSSSSFISFACSGMSFPDWSSSSPDSSSLLSLVRRAKGGIYLPAVEWER